MKINQIITETSAAQQAAIAIAKKSEQGVDEGKTGPGLWANIHAKRERIKSGSGERMRKPGSKGAPTAKNFKDAASEGVAEGKKSTLDLEFRIRHKDNIINIYAELDGVMVGYAKFNVRDNTLVAGKVSVDPDYRRQGIATAIYDYAKDQGYDIVPSQSQTDLGREFWKDREAKKDMAEGFNGEYDDEAGMAETNLHTIARAAQGLLDTIDKNENLPEWVQEKIAKVEGMLVTAWDYLKSQEEQGVDPRNEETYDGDEFYNAYGDLWYDEDMLNEAEYQGRKVQLGKPMQGDVKKFKVYVKDPSTGNIKKVNFGDPNMRIKKSNPARRKSFRARHNCDNPGPRTKARYWSCRKW